MVEKYIKYLLFEHDCVVIPDFGGFIANYVSADIHPIRHSLVPPSKNIAFNELLKLNDGMLVAYIANHERLSREEAQKAVKDFVEYVKEEIRVKGKYVFDEIGTLFLNHEQKLQFEPENKVNYLSNSFGLPELNYQPVERTSSYNKFRSKNRPAIPVVSGEDDDTAYIFTPKRKRSGSKILVAVLLPVIVLLTVGTGYFLFIGNDNQALSSFNPFAFLQETDEETGEEEIAFIPATEEETSINESQDNIPVTPEQFPTEQVIDNTNTPESGAVEPTIKETKPVEKKIAIEKEKTVSENTKIVTPVVKEKEVKPTNNAVKENVVRGEVAKKIDEKAKESIIDVLAPNATPRYYLIIGGFSVEKNALKLKSQLKASGNSQAKILIPKEGTNLLKVSYADYASAEEAAAKMAELKSTYSSVWVFKY